MRNKKGQFIKGTHWRCARKHWDKEWLYDQYVTQRKSAKQIADENGLTENGVIYWIKKHQIETRTMKFIRQNKHWGQVGTDNPMWNKTGELNPNWKGGITKDRQIFYQSQEWKTACSIVWKRDNAKCQRCGILHLTDIPMHIHHIKPFNNKELRANPDNLILLCEVCHRYVHSRKNINGDFIDG